MKKAVPDVPQCRKCKVVLTSYNAVPRYLEKRTLICKLCNRAAAKAMHRLRTYGMRQEDFEHLVAFQEGKCAICRTKFSDFGNRLNIDHCHETGWVRGILCYQCNTGLGAFRDNRHFLANAIRYLQHNHSPPAQPAKVLKA